MRSKRRFIKKKFFKKTRMRVNKNRSKYTKNITKRSVKLSKSKSQRNKHKYNLLRGGDDVMTHELQKLNFTYQNPNSTYPLRTILENSKAKDKTKNTYTLEPSEVFLTKLKSELYSVYFKKKKDYNIFEDALKNLFTKYSTVHISQSNRYKKYAIGLISEIVSPGVLVSGLGFSIIAGILFSVYSGDEEISYTLNGWWKYVKGKGSKNISHFVNEKCDDTDDLFGPFVRQTEIESEATREKFYNKFCLTSNPTISQLVHEFSNLYDPPLKRFKRAAHAIIALNAFKENSPKEKLRKQLEKSQFLIKDIVYDKEFAQFVVTYYNLDEIDELSKTPVVQDFLEKIGIQKVKSKEEMLKIGINLKENYDGYIKSLTEEQKKMYNNLERISYYEYKEDTDTFVETDLAI